MTSTTTNTLKEAKIVAQATQSALSQARGQTSVTPDTAPPEFPYALRTGKFIKSALSPFRVKMQNGNRVPVQHLSVPDSVLNPSREDSPHAPV